MLRRAASLHTSASAFRAPLAPASPASRSPSRANCAPSSFRKSFNIAPSVCRPTAAFWHCTRKYATSEAPEEIKASEKPRKCTGCGVKLQTAKEDARGFVPLPKFEVTVGDIICYRCWGMRHHNKLTKPEIHDVGVIEKVLKGKKCTLIKVIDILDVHGSFIPNFSRLASGLPVVVIGNKFDLLPNGAKPERVRQWLKAETQKLGLSPAQVSDYLLLSAKTGEGFTSLKNVLKVLAAREVTGKEIFVVGSTNVGKSSFINRIMDRFERKGSDLTVSHFPGTTLDILSFALNSGQTLYDTPGVTNTNHIIPLLTSTELDFVLPRKSLQPVTYRLMAGKTIFLGGLVRLDVLSTGSSPFCYITFFTSSELMLALHATRTERASEVYNRHVGKLLRPPLPSTTDKPRDFPPLEQHNIRVKCSSWTQAECDITLGGVGWASVTGEGEVSLSISVPHPVKPIITAPLMPFELEDRKERRIRKHGKLHEQPVVPSAAEPQDIDKIQLEGDVEKSREALPITLRRWKSSR